MLLLIAVTSFATVVLAVLALGYRPPNPVRARAYALADRQSSRPRSESGTFAGRVVVPLLRRLSGLLVGLLPHRWLQRLQRLLVAAGDPLPLDLYLFLWLAIGGSGGAIGYLAGGLRGLALGGFLGLALPFLWLRGAVRSRRDKIRRALPDMLDLLVTCVEAGLGLDAALLRVGAATRGPLGEEVNLTMRQIAVGRPRQEALLDLGIRPGVSELESVIRPVIQAERSGVSIATALRVQADALRTRRRQRAQEEAQKMSVKMMLPIAAFLLPATLIVAVGPAVFSFIDFFRGL
mgnify:CR=1 FL=1